MKKIITLLVCSFSFLTTYAQNPGWHELGTGANALNANDSILCVASDYNGNVYCAGAFTNALGKHYVAKWDGNAWTEVGGLNGLAANGNINCIQVSGSNQIEVAGSFTNANGKYYVARWNGNTWSELGSGVNGLNANGPIRCISYQYVAGDFKNSNNKCYVAEWNGTSWVEVGTGINALNANSRILFLYSNGGILCGGEFKNANGNLEIKYYNYTTWSTTGIFQGNRMCDFIDVWGMGLGWSGVNYFLAISNPTLSYVSVTTNPTSGNNWTNINAPLLTASTLNGLIRTLGRNYHNGADIIAAGSFKNTFGNYYVAKFSTFSGNGTWSELGANSLNPLNANGEIVATEIDTFYSSPCSIIHYYAAGKFTNANGKYYVAEYLEPVIWGTPGTPQSIVSASADTICHGTLVNFMCTTTNAGNSPVYNWYKNNLSVGSNSASISLSNLNNQDSVWCDVNPNTLCVSANSVISNKIQLTDYQIPVFQTQPTNVSANTGSTSYFKATANNAMHYQWQVNNGTGYQNLMNAGSYNGTTTDSLIITNVNLGLSNNYYRCIATNGICSDTSNYGILTVSQGNGISQLQAESINIYPNPATNQINIVSNAVHYPLSYTVYNEFGQALLVGDLKSNTTSLDISSLATGNYVLLVGTKHLGFVKNK